MEVNSRVNGTLDVVSGLLNVALLRVGLGSGSSLVGERLSALRRLVNVIDKCVTIRLERLSRLPGGARLVTMPPREGRKDGEEGRQGHKGRGRMGVICDCHPKSTWRWGKTDSMGLDLQRQTLLLI